MKGRYIQFNELTDEEKDNKRVFRKGQYRLLRQRRGRYGVLLFQG